MTINREINNNQRQIAKLIFLNKDNLQLIFQVTHANNPSLGIIITRRKTHVFKTKPVSFQNQQAIISMFSLKKNYKLDCLQRQRNIT